MSTIAVIGMGSFGCRIIDALQNADEIEVIVADRDRGIVEKYRDKIKDSIITDAINSEVLGRFLPDDLFAAVVDMGDNLETSILVTNFLHNRKVPKIIVKAKGDEHGEILKLLGATDVVYPDFDAAQKITQLLVSADVYDFMQVSSLFAMAEVRVRPELSGKTLTECNFRGAYRLNVIAARADISEELALVKTPDFTLISGQRILVAGTEADIHAYIGERAENAAVKKPSRLDWGKLFRRK